MTARARGAADPTRADARVPKNEAGLVTPQTSAYAELPPMRVPEGSGGARFPHLGDSLTAFRAGRSRRATPSQPPMRCARDDPHRGPIAAFIRCTMPIVGPRWGRVGNSMGNTHYVTIVSFTGKEIDASIRWVLGVAQSMRSGGSRMGSDGLLDGRCPMKTGPIECIEGSLVVSGQSRDCFLSCGRGAPPVHHRPDPGPGGPCGPSPACATGWILSPGRYGGCFTSHIRKKAREHAFLKLVAKAGSRPLELGGSATTLAPLH